MLNKYHSSTLIVLFVVIMLNVIEIYSLNYDSQSGADPERSTQRILSRKRRYLIFPTGSSIQLGIVLVLAFIPISDFPILKC